MDISIKHGEVKTFARNLSNWAQQMRGVRNEIMSRTHQLESHWRDPQYRMFVDLAQTHGKNLGNAIEQFEKASRNLNLMVADMERTQQAAAQRIRNNT